MKNSDLYAVITCTNNKGGIGKTASSVNLSVTLGALGAKVLFIDGDPQGNGTKAMGVRDKFNPATQTLWHAFRNKLSYKDVRVASSYKNVDVIAASTDLEDATDVFSSSPRRLKLFKQLLQGAEQDYNYVFIDTPPAKGGVLTPAALSAADYYIIPSFAESDSYDGFVKIVSVCEEIKDAENEKLTCLGVLITCLKKNPASQAYLDYVTTLLKSANLPVFPHFIAQSDSMDSARLLGKPAVTLPNAAALKDGYLANAKFIVSQIKESKAGRPKKGPDLEKLGLIKNSSPLDEMVIKETKKLNMEF